MKLTQLTTLIAMALGTSYGAYAAEDSQHDTNANNNPNNVISYPKTKIHQHTRDDFLQGEYGRPDGFISPATANNSWVNTGDSSVYPRPDDGVDSYFDEVIVDKYRWLEDVDVINAEYARETSADRERNTIGSRLENDIPDNQFDNRTNRFLQTVFPRQSSEVNTWVDAQNATTLAYLEQIPYYEQVYRNIDSLMNRHHSITKEKRAGVGEIHYFRAPDGFGRIVYTDMAGVEHELLNEQTVQADGNAKIADGDIYVSPNGTYVAFFLASGNADKELRSLRVLEVKTGQEVAHIKHMTDWYFELEWLDDDSFLYIARDNQQGYYSHIYRHHVKSKRFNDPIEVDYRHLVNAGSDSTIQSFYLEGENNRYLVINAESKGAMIDFVKDRQTGKIYRLHNDRAFRQRFARAEDFAEGVLSSFVHLDEKTLDVYFVSGDNTPRGELVKSNLNNLRQRQVIVPVMDDYDYMLEAIYHAEGDGYFLIRYRKDATERIAVANAQGRIIKDLTPSTTGVIYDLDSYVPTQEEIDAAKQKGDTPPQAYVWFRYYNTITPRTDYQYSISQDEFIDIRRRDLYPFVSEDYESKQVFYTSKDGTQIPMVISHKKGLVLDGKNPTVLYGYGGFNLPSDNAFRPDRAVWLEHGGVWATANLRGGNEYGDAWHEAGKRMNKMNVFDDFEAAADYLINQGYTTPDYLAISGASNGGLLVGAAMTLNPSKYRVALPEVGVLDMLRHSDSYHHTNYWIDEFGTAHDSREMYNLLRSYSPYHNIKAGVCYPSTIVMTSKRDDRVTPSHSYKFAAALQEHQACNRPTLLYAAQTHGHGPNTWAERKQNYHITTAFRLHEMGITEVPTDIYRPSVEELKGQKWLDEEAKEQAKTLAERQQYLDSHHQQ